MLSRMVVALGKRGGGGGTRGKDWEWQGHDTDIDPTGADSAKQGASL